MEEKNAIVPRFLSPYQSKEKRSTAAASTSHLNKTGQAFVRFIFSNSHWKLPNTASNIEKGEMFKEWYKRDEGRAEMRKERKFYILTNSHDQPFLRTLKTSARFMANLNSPLVYSPSMSQSSASRLAPYWPKFKSCKIKARTMSDTLQEWCCRSAEYHLPRS